MTGHRGLYLAAIIAVGISALFGLLQPQVIRIVLDVGLGGKTWDGAAWVGRILENQAQGENWGSYLWSAAAVLVLLTALSGFFLYLKGRWSAIAAEGTARKMRDRLYGHLQSLPYSYHAKASTGDLIQRCTSDVETVRGFLATQAVEVGRGVVLVILTAALMLALDVRMTLVSLGVIPVIFAFGFFFFLRVKSVFSESDESEGRLSATLQENLAGIRVVRAFARRSFEAQKFDVRNADYRDRTYRLIRLLAWYWSVSDFLCLTQIGLVLVIGGLSAARGDISLGTMVVFFTYVGRLLWPVRQMGRILTEMGKATVALGRIQQVLDERAEVETGTVRRSVTGRIEFENVSFAYPDGRPVLRNISFAVEPGEVVALLGPTGSGKTTLAQLIPRLYDPTTGVVRIDGIPTLEWNRKHLREKVSIILQEPFLFNRSVRENIALAVPGSPEREIQEAAFGSSLHDVIESFDNGYETIVGEGGVTLSGGQKQRMALARTLIRRPSVLIIDDSLSAVDAETDARIRERLKERYGGATVLLIAHRITTLREADRIFVLQDGRITQQGNHDALVREDGLYRRIWEIQTAGAEEVA